MSEKHWYDELPAAVTVCDPDGIILEMNQRSAQTFANDGGMELIGQNLYDCHPEPSRTRLREMMANQQTNIYTIQKNGVKKLIYQSPWYKDGVFAGFVEMSIILPENMPHFNRDKK